MIVIWGQRFCGKISVVPGLFYVATRFFHAWYIPLIPLGTFLVADDDEDPPSARPISLSVPSILMGWARGAMVLGALLMLIWGVSSVFFGTPMVIDEYVLVFVPDLAKAIEIPFIIQALLFYGVVLFLAFLCMLGYWLSTMITKAGYARALELAQEAQLPREVVEQHFGKARPLAVAAPMAPAPGARGEPYGQVSSQPFK